MDKDNTGLSDADVARIIEHMNTDHSDSVLAYAKHFGGLSNASEAKLLAVDSISMCLLVLVYNVEGAIRISFDHELKSAHDAHMTMVKMAKAASRALSEASPVAKEHSE